MGYLGPQLNQSVPTTQAKVEGNAIVSTPENSVQSVWILQQVGEEIWPRTKHIQISLFYHNRIQNKTLAAKQKSS